jgi:hypothetical protein
MMDPYGDYMLTSRALRTDIEYLDKRVARNTSGVMTAMIIIAFFGVLLILSSSCDANRAHLQALIEAHPELFPEEENH